MVETGVYRKGTEPAHPPTKIVEDVGSAVEWAVGENEGWDRDVKAWREPKGE